MGDISKTLRIPTQADDVDCDPGDCGGSLQGIIKKARRIAGVNDPEARVIETATASLLNDEISRLRAENERMKRPRCDCQRLRDWQRRATETLNNPVFFTDADRKISAIAALLREAGT